LGDIADSFISRCRKASIRQEFPGELLNETLGNIKAGNAANYKKAWKLLNDRSQIFEIVGESEWIVKT
jgi:hypothetical protein